MDDKKICFIVCTNNPRYMRECEYYINRLEVPEGYSIDLLSVTDATSMTSGYNEAMAVSDAKYKVYLHQDVFIVYTKFLYRLIEIFDNPQIGMFGMVGAPQMPEHAVMWYTARAGRLYSSNISKTSDSVMTVPVNGMIEVEAVDGLLMATQYDIPWREDLFKGWDYYDVSQSQEFIRAGYKVVVPQMDTAWCLHDDGFLNLSHYFDARRIYLREYGGYQIDDLTIKEIGE